MGSSDNRTKQLSDTAGRESEVWLPGFSLGMLGKGWLYALRK